MRLEHGDAVEFDLADTKQVEQLIGVLDKIRFISNAESEFAWEGEKSNK